MLTITGTERNRESKEDAVNVTGTIKGSEIELELASGGQGKEIMGRQNALLWPTALIAGNVQDVQFDINYNDKLLTEKISSLNVVVSGAEGARPARPVFDGAAFVIEPEVYGVSSDKIGKKIREYIGELKSEVSLMEEDCLEIPAFLSDSPEVEKACEQMNQYCLAQIVYQMEEEIVVDEKLISGWLNCDENMNVSLNEDAVGEWVRGMAEQYDTAGGTRSITTPTGKTAEVSGGTYGWKIDTAAETAALIKNIRDGDTVSREPAYTQRAAARSAQDWGGGVFGSRPYVTVYVVCKRRYSPAGDRRGDRETRLRYGDPAGSVQHPLYTAGRCPGRRDKPIHRRAAVSYQGRVLDAIHPTGTRIPRCRLAGRIRRKRLYLLRITWMRQYAGR